MKRCIVTVICAIALVALLAGNARATPAYAKKEGKPCSFCHTKPPALNAAGNYYKTHNHSLKGYSQAAASKSVTSAKHATKAKVHAKTTKAAAHAKHATTTKHTVRHYRSKSTSSSSYNSGMTRTRRHHRTRRGVSGLG